MMPTLFSVHQQVWEQIKLKPEEVKEQSIRWTPASLPPDCAYGTVIVEIHSLVSWGRSVEWLLDDRVGR